MGAGRHDRGGGDHGGGGHDAAGGMRWLLTYSDMITLLLALFIFLFSISSINVTKFQAFSEAFMQVMGMGPTPIPTTTPSAGEGVLPLPGRPEPHVKVPPPPSHEKGKTPGEKEESRKALKELEKKLQAAFPDLLAQKRLVLIEEPEGLVLRLQETTLFDLGSASVSEQAKPVLAIIASHLRELPNLIRVEGHTDDLPIRSGSFPSNWELSGARAASVLQDFIERGGIPPERLSLAGYGEFRPVAPNEPGKGNAQNRRVEIVVLEQSLAPSTPSTESPE